MADTGGAYVKILQPQGHARYGKLEPGKIVAMSETEAGRFIGAGVGEKSSREAWEKQREQKQKKADSREAAFARLNEQTAAYWDVSTHRDALTAPEEGLRQAKEAGVPLVNLDVLVDEDGLPLPDDPSVEDILKARANLHPASQDPYGARERASTQGGGSHYDMPLPLNPRARAIEQTIRDNERSQGTRAAMAVGYDTRRRQAGRVSEEGRKQAQDAGVREPAPASGEQVGNAAEPRERAKKD